MQSLSIDATTNTLQIVWGNPVANVDSTKTGDDPVSTHSVV